MTTAILCGFALLSGAASLVYQIVWMRRLVLVFGSAALATSTVLVVFLGGLALGAWVWGRTADRRPAAALATYGIVELGIGVYALASPWAFKGIEQVYLAAYPSLAGRPGPYAGLQFVLSGLVILVPTMLMGGTVPLLARGVAGRGEPVQAVGTLYGWNTLGGAVGAALATYAWLPLFGLQSTLAGAAAVNGLVGGGALLLHASGRRAAEAEPLVEQERARGDADPRLDPSSLALLLVGFGLSGLAAMGDEIVWTRLLGLVVGSSVYAFGTIVVVMLAGLGLGSALYGRLRLEPRGHLLAFGAIEAGLGVAGLVSLVLAPQLPFVLMWLFPLMRATFAGQLAAHAALAALIAFVPALLMGAAFPAAVGSLAPALTRVGRAVGLAYAANTAGTVLGAYLAGFVLVPGLGLRTTLVAAVVANLVAGATVLFVTLPRRRRWPVLASAAAALAAVLWLPPWPREVLAIGTGFFAPMFASTQGLAKGVAELRLLYYRDGINTTISVDEAGGQRVYRSNGKTDASTYPRDLANQVLLGHVPMLLHPGPADVFVLGLGTGVTAAAVARHPVRRIDVAELEPAALDAARFFERENHGVLRDPRVRVILGDGRHRLLAAPDRYDVVVSDASDIWFAGVGALFTLEFYETVRSRLRPGGIMVQWLHTSSLAAPEFRLLVGTFRAVFPRVSVWSSGIGDVFLLGSLDPLPWVYERVVRRIDGTPGVREGLQSAGVWHPAALFAAFVIGEDGVERLVGHTPRLHTDDRPTLEFVTPRSLYVDTITELEQLMAGLRGPAFPPIEGFDPGRDLDALATYAVGFAYAAQGRAALGIGYMERSVAMAPTRAPFWVGLGTRYREVGRRGDAERAYGRAVTLDPANVPARLALAAFLLDEGQPVRALEAAEAAQRLEPANARVAELVRRARTAAPR